MTQRKSDWITTTIISVVIVGMFYVTLSDTRIEKARSIMEWVDNGFRNPHRERLRKNFGKEMAEKMEKELGIMNIYGEIEPPKKK